MDGECLVLLVRSDLEVKLLACVKDRGFGQRRVSDFIEGIRRAFTGHGWFQGLSAAGDEGGHSSLMRHFDGGRQRGTLLCRQNLTKID